MSIERFFKTLMTTKRMSWNNESSVEVSVTSFNGHIQQANAEFTQMIGEAWGKVYTVWCDEATNVEPGDTITISTGDNAGTFSVKNIQKNVTGNNKHLEIIAIKDL